METFARVFSSSNASRFPANLAAELTSAQPLVWEESLYASYVKREPSQYTHNPTRASVAITSQYRLVVVAAGSKQIDIPLTNQQARRGLRVWTEKKGGRIHFKVDLGVYGTGMGGASLEVRVETPNAGRIMAVVDSALPAGEKDVNVESRSALGRPAARPAGFPTQLRSGILAESLLIFEEGLPGRTTLRRPGHTDVENKTSISIAITQGMRLVVAPLGESYSDFPLTVKWCRDALRVWVEEGDGVVVFEIQTGPFRPESQGEVRTIRAQTASAVRIRNIVDSAYSQGLDGTAQRRGL